VKILLFVLSFCFQRLNYFDIYYISHYTLNFTKYISTDQQGMPNAGIWAYLLSDFQEHYKPTETICSIEVEALTIIKIEL
jgi:hypothetical protein